MLIINMHRHTKKIQNNNEKKYIFQILTGNINTYSEVERELQPIIVAQKIRIYPYSQYDRTVCLRAELIGCPFDGEYLMHFFFSLFILSHSQQLFFLTM